MFRSKSKIFIYPIKYDLGRSLFNNVHPLINCSTNEYSTVKLNTETMRRGTGGRSSFNGNVVTVFGASGFLGKYIVNQLGKIGTQIVIPYRGTFYGMRELRLMGDLGQIVFLPFSAKNDDDIRKAIKYSNVVINLIGKDSHTRNFSHEETHIDIAARIARLSKEKGVEKLIHFSALNASPNLEEICVKGGCRFLKSKGQGEIEVRREFPEAIIFRPSDMYGHDDRFLCYYNRPERYLNVRPRMPVKRFIPLWKKGCETFKQPVFGGDVAKAVIYATMEPECLGVTVEALGPHRYRLDHLVTWINLALNYKADQLKIINIPPLFQQKIKFFEYLKPKYPVVSLDKFEREFHSDSPMNLLGLQDMNVQELTNLEDRISYEVNHMKKYGYYQKALTDREPVKPPPRA